MKKSNRIVVTLTIAALSAMAFGIRLGGQDTSQSQGAAQASSTVAPPSPERVFEGETEAKKLLKLMDTDKNGKISRQEFMTFMEAEFNRMDVNKDGELDVKELTQSPVRSVAGGHK
jgi:EF hand